MAATAAALAPARPIVEQEVIVRAEINRANAQHSTGPRTEQGKARSSRNALKHGIFLSLEALPPCERATVEQIRARVPFSDDPSPDFQALALEIALLHYRRERVRSLEFATYADGVSAICDAEGIPEPEGLYERSRIEVRVFRADCAGPRTLARLHTYERTFTREIDKAYERLYLLRRQRESREAQIETREQMLRELDANPRASHAHLTESAVSSSPVASFSQNPQTPRSAQCPCGSGLKYKRCCGRNAPAQLHQ